ncbi:hypothetical protein XENTR_v10005090 [Xenopus tropicalis]|uniref:Uncharacterized protein LOC100495598 n=1 Tax=Xenopus tropicalis TaxID=8364 RepID=A0A8J0QQD7_XENTR|nr:uncharacterized protein LOC100495598 [Xenopus tropicalis]KAE8622090.1 hypothetical protein XENTR_v10005090 [Xenopus tropicalis]|eukprot:XP_002938966.2 PREDICTED: uncharacterized protein LOC100495598 [Xenopus tropicalis]
MAAKPNAYTPEPLLCFLICCCQTRTGFEWCGLSLWGPQPGGGRSMAALASSDPPCDTLEQRKHKGQNLYYQIYVRKMQELPPDVHRFCDPELSAPRRKELLHLLRSLEEGSSCQRLQILFSFSVPSPMVLELLCALREPLVSAGAGTGYWEFLLQSRGLDVVAFDQNNIFPPEMRYTEIMTAGPEILELFPDRALLLAWPDADESSKFSRDCLTYYRGKMIFHVGELLGETVSSNPWGQSSTRDFQLCLAEEFCCVKRLQLPNWPGQVDSFTVWKRKSPQLVLCDGAHFQYVDTRLEEAP